MERVGILQRMRTAGLLLALFALTFKAFLPPGFMIDASADRVAIVLCNGAGAVLDLGHDQQAPSSDSSSQHCPFAFASAPTVPEPGALAPAPSFAFSLDAAAPVTAAVGVREATGPPLPARGPPLLA